MIGTAGRRVPLSRLRKVKAGLSEILPVAGPSSRPLCSSPTRKSYSTSAPLRLAFVQGGSPSTAGKEKEIDFSDISIVGGGVVGLALASSLASNRSFQSSYAKLTLIEGSSLDKAREWAKTKQDGSQGPISDWENRVIYLTEENRQWLDDIGVTPYLMSSRLGPVHSMMVTDGVSGAALNFDVPAPESQRMGTMVEISNLQQAMLHQIESLKSAKGVKIQILDSSRVEAIEAEGEEGAPTGVHIDSWPLVRYSTNDIPLKSRLLIGADGNNSPVRKYAGINAAGWEYGRMGVVATMKTRGQELGERTAFQKFLPTGTIAWLPVSKFRTYHESSRLTLDAALQRYCFPCLDSTSGYGKGDICNAEEHRG